MPTPLPSIGSLLGALDAFEKVLDDLEDSRTAQTFVRSSSDGLISATADGMGYLVSVVIDPDAVTNRSPSAVADLVKPVVNAALAAANAATAANVTGAASGWSLPGLPSYGQSPPGYEGFADQAQSLQSLIKDANPCDPGKTFECSAGPVHATLNGRREVTSLSYDEIPSFLPYLGSSTVDAVNCATDHATQRQDDTQGVVTWIVDNGTSSAVLQKVVIYANGELHLADRVVLQCTGESSYGRIMNAGSVETNLGVEVQSGDVESRAPVVLRERAHVHGFLRTAANLSVQNNTKVDGPVTENARMLLPKLALDIAFPATAKAAISLEPDATKAAGPDYYAQIIVKSRAKLTLKTGVYFCDDFQIEPQGQVFLSQASGPIIIYVRNNFTFRGSITDVAGGFPRLFIGHLGTSTAVVEAPFCGTLCAPKAKIYLSSAGRPGYSGAFHGKDIDVEPDMRVCFHPFEIAYKDLPAQVTSPPPPPPPPPPPSGTPSATLALLGFEDLSAWSTTQATLKQATTPVTQGAHSLQVSTPKGYTEINSVPFSTAGLSAPKGTLLLDLWIGATQPNPSWVGQLQVFVSVPSANVYNAPVGQQELTPLPRKSWNTVQLSMPAVVAAAIGSTHTDATIKLVLNVNANSGPYYVDNLRFA